MVKSEMGGSGKGVGRHHKGRWATTQREEGDNTKRGGRHHKERWARLKCRRGRQSSVDMSDVDRGDGRV